MFILFASRWKLFFLKSSILGFSVIMLGALIDGSRNRKWRKAFDLAENGKL